MPKDPEPVADPTCHLCGSSKRSVNYSAAERQSMFAAPRLRVAWVCPRCDLLGAPQ